MLIQALTMGGVFGLVMLLWNQDVAQVIVAVPIFSAMMYFSYAMTNRIAARFRPRPVIEEPDGPVEPSSERPDHALRRRTRRRRRGRREGGSHQR